LIGHENLVSCISFNQNGLLASGSNDRTIKLWNTYEASVDREGLLASDRMIQVWNTKTGECLRTLTGHGNLVTSVSFDQDGLLASGSNDRPIKIEMKYGTDIEFLVLLFFISD